MITYVEENEIDIEDIDHTTKHLDDNLIYRNLDENKVRSFVKAIVESWEKNNWSSSKEYQHILQKLKKEYSISPNGVQINYAYRQLIETNQIVIHRELEKYFAYKNVRHNSGVCVIAILTSPGHFSCPKDCYYCPNEPGQPRSYLSGEPGVIRANENNFDACRQIWNRATSLALEGHPVDKIELLVLGGTWSNYPLDYQEEFIRDIYYASNVFYCLRDNRRPRKSLEEEIMINRTARCRVIGITLETRPDFITKEEIMRFRRYGITRVQIGVQHTDDKILKKINRECYTKDTINCLRLLKNNGFKIDIHLMPDLPFSSFEKDKEMFDRVLSDPDLQADQWKIYPCEITPYTVIEKWYNEGKYQPMEPKQLIELILYVKPLVPEWIRLNRIIRDIPNQHIIGGNEKTNLREDIQKELKKRGQECRCIRCREVRQNKKVLEEASNAQLVIRKYQASGGDELFISFETQDLKNIYGFVRLRLSPKINEDVIFPEFRENTAWIRELHVYGLMNPTIKRDDNSKFNKVQGLGFGKRLMKIAEDIAYQQGYRKLAVISGVGVSEYYRKIGYHMEQTYMVKDLEPNIIIKYRYLIICVIVMFIIMFYLTIFKI